MQLSALIYSSLTMEEKEINDYILSTEDEFVLSNNQNVVVFVLDTFDAEWFEIYLYENDEYKGLFNDFTYFSNVVSGGAPTHLGMPTMLTGKVWEVRKSPIGNM